MNQPQAVEGLASLFQATLSPDHATRKGAEAQIVAAQSQPGYPQLLLSLVSSGASAGISPAVRLAAAVNFKNLCKTTWNDSEDREEWEQPNPALVREEDKAVVRQQILPLLFGLSSTSSGSPAASASLRSSLEEGVALIAEQDFPDQWPSLIDDLVTRLDSGISQQDQGVLLETLQLSHSIFKRWRSAFRSNSLFTTINLVLGKYAKPFLALLQQTDAALSAQNAQQSPASVKALAQALDVEIQIFYDLSCQDLPPQFEDNLDKTIAPILLRWLSFSRPELVSADNDDDDTAQAGELERIRAGVCEVAELYAQRYLDVFSSHLPSFVQAVWQMLSSAGQSQRFDLLVNRGIGLLSTIVRMGNQKEMFDNADTLKQLVTGIILPNAQLRESDEELFEDNPIEYIRRDFEVSTGR